LILDSPIKLSADDKKLAIAEWGPITNRLFLTPSEIYYMNSHIGTRKGKEFKLFPKFFAVTQELHDALWEVL
jgi:hypothetical protein